MNRLPLLRPRLHLRPVPRRVHPTVPAEDRVQAPAPRSPSSRPLTRRPWVVRAIREAWRNPLGSTRLPWRGCRERAPVDRASSRRKTILAPSSICLPDSMRAGLPHMGVTYRECLHGMAAIRRAHPNSRLATTRSAGVSMSSSPWGRSMVWASRKRVRAPVSPWSRRRDGNARAGK
jgi:hypothetical protein